MVVESYYFTENVRIRDPKDRRRFIWIKQRIKSSQPIYYVTEQKEKEGKYFHLTREEARYVELSEERTKWFWKKLDKLYIEKFKIELQCAKESGYKEVEEMLEKRIQELTNKWS